MANDFEVEETFHIAGRGTVIAGRNVGTSRFRIGDEVVDGSVRMAIKGGELLKTLRPGRANVGLLVDVPGGHTIHSGAVLGIEAPARHG